MAYSTILVAYYIKIITFKMTGFPIIIIYKIKTVSQWIDKDGILKRRLLRSIDY